VQGAFVHIAVLLAALTASGAIAAGSSNPKVRPLRGVEPFGHAIAFEPNVGQAPGDVAFVAHRPGAVLLLSSTGVRVIGRLAHAGRALGLSSIEGLRFVGAASTPGRGDRTLPGMANYLLGNDPSRWHGRIPTYGRVTFRDIYPGIDLVFHGETGKLEYDFVIRPDADEGRIQVAFEGAPAESPRWAMYEFDAASSPKPVRGAWVQHRNQTWGFGVARRDRSKTLLIDPAFNFSTYLGGNTYDYGFGIVVGASGNAYVAGQTASTNFPTTTGLQGTYGGGNYDAFVTKLDPLGTTLLFSTYLGGSGDEGATCIAAATTVFETVYVAGATTSADFPTHLPLQPTLKSATGNAFVTALTYQGALLYSTYLGGSGTDSANAIAAVGTTAYVAGVTSSTDFPTANAFQSSLKGNSNAFVAEIASAGMTLAFSTYLGGSGGFDAAAGVAIDAPGNIYVVGKTYSSDFPTLNALQTALHGVGPDAFVTKFNPGGAGLSYSTFLGGSGIDWAQGIALGPEPSPNVYVTGLTQSADFPTVNPLQATYGGSQNAFVAQLNDAGSALVYSTFLGGAGLDVGNGVAVDSSGIAYVVGSTNSPDFPAVNAIQSTFGGGTNDVFVAALNAAGSALLYSTFLGGTGNDLGAAVALDRAGNPYLTGSTSSIAFPMANAVQSTLAGSRNAFVSSIVPDGGPRDGGGAGDAGSRDSGILDAGASGVPDGGATDAGLGTPDAGFGDAGAGVANRDRTLVGCACGQRPASPLAPLLLLLLLATRARMSAPLRL